MEGGGEGPASTRDDLLRAGAELAADTVASQILPGVRAVCREVGIGPATFYRHFDDVEDFHAALIGRLLERSPLVAAADELATRIVTAAEETSDDARPAVEMASAVARMAGESFSQLDDRASPDDLLQPMLIGLSQGDDAVADAVRDGYRLTYGRVRGDDTAAIAAAVESLGGVVRPPFTAASVGVVFRAVYEGLRMRSLVDETFDAVTVLEDVTRVLLVALLANPDRPDDIDTLLEQTVDEAGGTRSD